MTSVTQLLQFLSLILRHEPDRHGVSLDPDGFAPLRAVWRAVQARYPGVYSPEDVLALREAVSGEHRFEFKDSPLNWRTAGHDPLDAILIGTAQTVLSETIFSADLPQSEADWLTAALHVLPDQALLVVDRDRRVRAAVGLSMLTTAIETEDVIGRALAEVLPAHVLTRMEAIIDAALRGETQPTEERTGDRVWLYHPFVLRTPSGDGFAVVILVRDVSDQRRIESALRDSQRFIERVTSTIPDAVYVYDFKQRRSIYNNREVASILGYSPQEITDMGETVLQQLLHPDDYVRQQAGEVRFLQAEDGEIIHSLYRMRHADGSWRWIAMRDTVFLRDEAGNPEQLLGVAQDVTAQLAAQEAALDHERLRIALQKEQELSKLQTSLMQRISHEFRTPLAIIQTGVELLDRYLERLSPDQRKEQIERIKHEIWHLAAMLDDVGRFVSGSGMDKDLNFQTFDLAQDLTHLTQEFFQIVQRDFNVQVPQQAVPVLADREMIHALVNNLLSNAVKFSRKEAPITVSLAVGDQQQRMVTITIADRGIGIPKHDLERLTEPFFRGSNVSQINGIGIGLAVVNLVVQAHGGQIDIDSAVNVGTQVTIRLPIGMDVEIA